VVAWPWEGAEGRRGNNFGASGGFFLSGNFWSTNAKFEAENLRFGNKIEIFEHLLSPLSEICRVCWNVATSASSRFLTHKALNPTHSPPRPPIDSVVRLMTV